MTRKSALCLALAAAFPAAAVTLNPDGLGQALIYPYYTVQSTGTDAYNTYISVVNHSPDAKALRLRFREARLGKSVLDMNVYLSPNDVWTGAVVPFSTGARLVSTDRSCTQPGFAVTVAPGEAPFVDFRNDAFSGSNDDGAGTGLDRTREGFVEIIEMATLTGASAGAVTHNSAGVPANCGGIGAAPLVAAPSGGLSGTLTLINVASGMDFTTNAEALDQLASRPFFRRTTDPYPDFNASEIDPVSIVEANGSTWRSTWSKPVDAVSAVLMRTMSIGEYVLDQATGSQTDFVLTMPTRHFYSSATAVTAPFSMAQWNGVCDESLSMTFFDREERGATVSAADFPEPPPNTVGPGVCGAVGVASINNLALPNGSSPPGSTSVLGSVARGLHGTRVGGIVITPNTSFQSGWMRLIPTARIVGLVSRADSVRFDGASGQQTAGPHNMSGLPMLGFSARTFRNGTLRCDAGSCLGNYGGAFPFKYRRSISPTP